MSLIPKHKFHVETGAEYLGPDPTWAGKIVTRFIIEVPHVIDANDALENYNYRMGMKGHIDPPPSSRSRTVFTTSFFTTSFFTGLSVGIAPFIPDLFWRLIHHAH